MSRGGGYKALYEQEQFLNQLGRDLERISGQQDSSRVIRFVLRRLGESLGADLVVQVDVRRTDGTFDRPFTLPLTPRGKKLQRRTEEAGFLDPFRAFLKRPLGPPDRTTLLLLASVEERPEAVLGFLRAGREFSREEARLGQDAARQLSENLRHRERERLQGLKERIYAKILSEIRPQDVLYQILHGLKRLLQYDHGGTVLLLDPERAELTVRAEIIAWTKAKSRRIGRRLPLTPEIGAWIEQTRHPLLLRAGEEAGGVPSVLLRRFRPEQDGEVPARAMIIAVLRHKGNPLGILQLCSRGASAFHPADVRVLDELLPLASVTLYNSALYMTQHDLLLSAERKTSLAVLARAISHDLANAFTVMLPLLQQMRQDAAGGRIDAARLSRDLEILERYSKSSSRIFQGLLSMARGTQEPPSWIEVPLVIEAIHRMLGPGLEGKRIEARRESEGEIPRVFLRRGDLEQVLLNLVYNARDAMPAGGSLLLRTRAEDGGVVIEVEDTGEGMTAEVRQRIFEPFFTTKRTGSGLGLDICRSIVWDYDGRIDLDSEPGRGTRVRIWLPRLAERLRALAETDGGAEATAGTAAGTGVEANASSGTGTTGTAAGTGEHG